MKRWLSLTVLCMRARLGNGLHKVGALDTETCVRWNMDHIFGEWSDEW